MIITVVFTALVPMALLGVWFWEARIFLYVFERIFFRIYKNPPFLSNIDEFLPKHNDIQANLTKILQEFTAYFDEFPSIPKAHEVDAYNAAISVANGPAWRTLYLKVYNGWFSHNVAKFPTTYALLSKMPQVTCVMFSVMEAGNIIPLHAGLMRGTIRYQMPLILSSHGECSIEVAGERRRYYLGEPLMFDDNNLHTVSNQTDGPRVILFLDVQKPSSTIVRTLDNFFMYIVRLSPKFKHAKV